MAKKKATSKSDAAPSGTVRVRLAIPGDVQATFANQMMVQQDEHSAYLTFFLAVPPVLVGTPDQVLEQLNKLDSIEGRFISQVIIPKSKLKDFGEALLKNLAANKDVDDG